MGQRHPFSPSSRPVIGEHERDLMHRRIRHVLQDTAIAAEVRRRLPTLHRHAPASNDTNRQVQDLSRLLVDFLEHNDGCALAFLAGHEKALARGLRRVW
jgi:hypothetical protein